MKFFTIIAAFILREMTTSHGKKSGGYLWAIVEPAAGIFLLSLVFSFLFRSPPLGENFPLFYATGILAFQMYTATNMKVAKSINASKSLLAYPMISIFDAIIARFILNTITQILVMIVIISAIIIFYDLDLIYSFEKIFLSLAMGFSLGLGIGTFNCALFTRFPAWSSMWSILNRPMFVISGVLFIMESAPKTLQYFLWFNPVIHITAQMRSGFYANYDAYFVSPAYVFMISCVLMFLGVVLITRYEKELINT